jgi:hypothetical protein
VPYTITVSQSVRLGTGAVSFTLTNTASSLLAVEEDIPAAKVGTLTTRTDDDTGELTMASGHGITTGAKLNVYWASGKRLGMTVGTVATNAVPIDGGTGDNLPADETSITAIVPVEFPFVATGNDVVGLEAWGATDGEVLLTESDNDSLLAIDVDEAGYAWCEDSGDANPVAGDAIAKVFLSHGDSTGARRMRLQLLVD